MMAPERNAFLIPLSASRASSMMGQEQSVLIPYLRVYQPVSLMMDLMFIALTTLQNASQVISMTDQTLNVSQTLSIVH